MNAIRNLIKLQDGIRKLYDDIASKHVTVAACEADPEVNALDDLNEQCADATVMVMNNYIEAKNDIERQQREHKMVEERLNAIIQRQTEMIAASEESLHAANATIEKLKTENAEKLNIENAEKLNIANAIIMLVENRAK